MNESLDTISVRPEAAIRDAMLAIDRGSVEIALVVDHDRRLLGTVSDGDIRRALLKGARLDDAVSSFMTRSPQVVSADVSRGAVLELMRARSLSQIPVVDADGRVTGLHVMQEMLVPLAVPFLGENAHRYVRECLDTNFVSSVGPFVDRFEREFGTFVGSEHAVACASGTAAIHVALQLLGAGPGDEVAVSTFTFIASANAVTYTGATPLLVDSEPRTWNMDTQRLRDEIERRAKAGERLPAVIEVVHLLGHPAEMEPLLDVRERFGIPIVEDAAEALGATYVDGPLAGRQVGTLGDIGCFSFNGNKIVTTGGGGMLVTNEAKLSTRARHLTTQAKLPGRGYLHDEIGYNYRLTNIAAALGVAQLEQLDRFLEAKRARARRYREGLEGAPCTPPPHEPWANPSFWLYTVLLTDDAPPRDRVLDDLNAAGVQARPIWAPVHQQGPYVDAPRLGGAVADRLYERGISLPSSVDLSKDDQDWVVLCMRSALRRVE